MQACKARHSSLSFSHLYDTAIATPVLQREIFSFGGLRSSIFGLA